MSNYTNQPPKLAVSTTCLPGSEAERKEKERIAAFLKAKAERIEQERLAKPEIDARRAQEYQEATEANRAMMRKKRST